MSLYVIKTPDPKVELIVYKVVYQWSGLLLGPYYKNYKYNVGWNTAWGQIKYKRYKQIFDPKTKQYTLTDHIMIEGGILHCFSHRFAALNFIHCFDDPTRKFMKIVSALGKPEHFVSYGLGYEIGFTSIYIPEK